MAIVFSVEHFHSFLNRRFQVVTDHGALAYWRKISSTTSARLQQYAMYLSKYCMDLVYRAGPLNVVADPISRLLKVDHTAGLGTMKQHDLLLRPGVAGPMPQATALSMTYTRTLSAPVAVIPVVGATVAVRVEHEPWLRRRLSRSVLTNADRFGVIKAVHKTKQVGIHFGSGALITLPVAKIQAIPLPDYTAALAINTETAGSTIAQPLSATLLDSQCADSELADLRRWFA